MLLFDRSKTRNLCKINGHLSDAKGWKYFEELNGSALVSLIKTLCCVLLCSINLSSSFFHTFLWFADSTSLQRIFMFSSECLLSLRKDFEENISLLLRRRRRRPIIINNVPFRFEFLFPISVLLPQSPYDREIIDFSFFLILFLSAPTIYGKKVSLLEGGDGKLEAVKKEHVLL
jgi:hypothetical protein